MTEKDKESCKKYNKTLFFHCFSHRLNLMKNDYNNLYELRNNVGTFKEFISFFRNRSVRVFRKYFLVVKEALETQETNFSTRNKALQLNSADSKVSFIPSHVLIAKYSSLLEPMNMFARI